MTALLSNSGDPRASDPAFHAVAVTPSDTADLTNVSTALYVGVTGNLVVTMAGGEKVTFSNVAVGWHPIRVSRVWTATTASSIVAVWRG